VDRAVIGRFVPPFARKGPGRVVGGTDLGDDLVAILERLWDGAYSRNPYKTLMDLDPSRSAGGPLHARIRSRPRGPAYGVALLNDAMTGASRGGRLRFLQGPGDLPGHLRDVRWQVVVQGVGVVAQLGP
jgi:hypothetical protein